jgi:hypothetical protein
MAQQSFLYYLVISSYAEDFISTGGFSSSDLEKRWTSRPPSTSPDTDRILFPKAIGYLEAWVINGVISRGKQRDNGHSSCQTPCTTLVDKLQLHFQRIDISSVAH